MNKTPKCDHQVMSNAGTFECRFCGARWPEGTKWGEILDANASAKLVIRTNRPRTKGQG